MMTDGIVIKMKISFVKQEDFVVSKFIQPTFAFCIFFECTDFIDSDRNQESQQSCSKQIKLN
jgi:hypothetical protein